MAEVNPRTLLKMRAEARLELNRRRRENYPAYYVPHKKQLIFHSSTKRNRWLIGANKSGKTEAGALEVFWWLTGQHPYRKTPTPPVHVWAVSVDFPGSRDVVQEKIKKVLPQRGEFKFTFYKQDGLIACDNGSILGFKSVESGWRKFQGPAMELIWFDEEPGDRAVFQECVMRGVDVRGEIVGTMTPLLGFTWLYQDLIAEPDADTQVTVMSQADNPYISKEELERIKDKYEGQEFQARILGDWVPMSGAPVFDIATLEKLKSRAKPPMWRGEIGSVDGKPKLFKNANGRLKIWESPITEAEYALGCDVAEGYTLERGRGSFSCVQLLRHTMDGAKLAATWHGDIEPDSFSEIICLLGKWFNEGEIGVEANNHGNTVISHLQRTYYYPYLYRRRVLAKKGEKPSSRIGWLTTKATKPVLVDELHRVIRLGYMIIPDETTINEMMTFVHTDVGYGPTAGSNDDRVLALGIALQVLTHYNPLEPFKPKKEKKPFDGYSALRRPRKKTWMSSYPRGRK